MGSYNRARCVVLLSLAFFSMSFAETPHFQGTFLQLWSDHETWTEDDWSQLFQELHDLKISDVVVQWSAYQDIRFYMPPGRTEYRSNGPILQRILRMADANGMRIYVGLRGDPQYWKILEDTAERRKTYFDDSLTQSIGIADQLAVIVKGHSSFHGWYISEEVEEGSWNDPQARAILFHYLRDLSAHMRKLTPSAKVAISGFTNGRQDPAAVAAFWGELLHTAPFDILFFQDGIGAGKLTLETLPSYLEAVSASAIKNRARMHVIVELFETSNPDPNADFKAHAAAWTRIQQQMNAAAPHSSSCLFAFSIPDYMRPSKGKAASDLLQHYRNSL